MGVPEKIGRYEILDELGHGAMGSVFRAKDPAMDRVVAVKTILASALDSEQGAEFRQRFYREARAAGALAHPGIVPVFDVGEADGVPYLVMEFVQGQTLANQMKRGERASLDRVCEIGQKIAEALGYAHRNGVVHRDIKPENILLTSREVYGEERPKITDFGIAKLGGGEFTMTGQFLGTPAFMPPEQFTGEPIDGRTDLFSLGVILYWMATGEKPFGGETMTSVSYKIVHTDPIPPAKLNPAIPARLESVILQCLAKNPANRPQTGEELAGALEDLRLNGSNTGARTTGLHTVAPVAVFGGGAPDETLASSRSLRGGSVVAAASASTVEPAALFSTGSTVPTSPAAKKSKAPLFAAIALVALAAMVGGGYLWMHRAQSVVQTAAPATAAVAQPATSQTVPAAATPSGTAGVAASTPGANTVPAQSQATPQTGAQTAPIPKPSAGQAAKAPTVSAAPAASQPQPAARVTFDPRKLDPKQSTRLKFGLDHLLPEMAVTVEMDGKLYFKGPAANKAGFDNLYVPTGVHEFRVTIGSGGAQRVSNIVSADFVAKKHMTLKIELRPQPSGSATALDPATKVVASLKTDFFPF